MTTVDVYPRWCGPADATSGSSYRIERSVDGVAWEELEASQAATSPYISPETTLAAPAISYEDDELVLTSSTGFSTAGYGWVDGEALVQWAGKTNNTLTGVVWRSSYGTYLAGSSFIEAHEEYEDLSVVTTTGAVVYRITHANNLNLVAAPSYFTFMVPPLPDSAEHCVVIVQINSDLGVEPREGIDVDCYLETDSQFTQRGLHLDAGQSANKTQTTNVWGLAFFQCWRTSARRTPGKKYVFVLDSANPGESLRVTATTIPDRPWVMLEDIYDA